MFKTAIYISLVLLLLINATGLTVNKHFCKQQLKSISLFVNIEDCHSEEASSYCEHDEDQTLTCCQQKAQQSEGECCDDETQYIKAETELISLTIKNRIAEAPQTFVILYSLWKNEIRVSNLFTPSPKNQPFSLHQNNFRVLIQSFLC